MGPHAGRALGVRSPRMSSSSASEARAVAASVLMLGAGRTGDKKEEDRQRVLDQLFMHR